MRVLVTWLMLGVAAALVNAQEKPRVFLNHVFVAPDSATYDAIVGSKFLREEFGAFEERTTVRKDMTYTGLYWYGQNTYFEILKPGASDHSPSGIAFGVERSGDLKALHEAGIPGEIVPVTRQAEGKDVNWFHMLMIAGGEDTATKLFAIEYEPEFLRNWYPQFSPAKSSIRRSDVLTRYAAKVGRAEQRQNGLLRDVAALQLNLAAAETKQLLDVCRKFGYVVKEGATASCIGPELTISVQNSNRGRRGIAAVVFRLGTKKTGAMRFGSSTLDFRGHTAVWTF